MYLEVIIEKIGRDAQDNLAKVQQDYQELKTERDGLKIACENLNAERDQL